MSSTAKLLLLVVVARIVVSDVVGVVVMFVVGCVVLTAAAPSVASHLPSGKPCNVLPIALFTASINYVVSGCSAIVTTNGPRIVSASTTAATRRSEGATVQRAVVFDATALIHVRRNKRLSRKKG